MKYFLKLFKSNTGRLTPNLLLLSVILTATITTMGCENSTGPDESAAESDLIAAGMTEEVAQMLEEAIQDEFHAEMIYKRVIADFGQISPFANIVNAEIQHSSSLALLLTRYDLEVPESKWNQDNVPVFDSVLDACQAAAQAEIANIALYDDYLSKPLPEDVRIVFENNRRASLDKHLPAFRRCGG